MTTQENTIRKAALDLSETERGTTAMRWIREFLNSGGLGLDGRNQRACLTLLQEAFGSMPGTVRDAIDEAIQQ